MPAQTVFTEQTGRVLTVRLHNPPRNLLDSQMVDELHELIKRLERDSSVGAVILTGAPDGMFVTHADSEEILRHARAGGYCPSYRQARALLRLVRTASALPGVRAGLKRTPLAGIVALRRADETFLRMNRLDKVFIAAINGVALGGGCVLALACDVRLMAEGDHAIGLIESNLGLMAAAGGTQRVTRILGSGRALELLLDGQALRPAEAQELGLIGHVVPADELLARAQEIAERLARRSPRIIRELKRAVYDAGTRRLRTGIRMEQASMLTTVSAPTAMRAMEAYHTELGSLEALNTDGLLATWDRLFEGSLVDFVD